ncbi:MAG TPA: anti-sigma factor [Chloroflexota bacterium]|jgi:hypothetical protein|nr:anti-sigma factor [Chloroflexota bacterium]
MSEPATMTCEEFLDLAAAVALDASDSEEVRRVERHAAECPECARQLDSFREVAAVIGSAVPQLEPPAALRGRVLEAARHTRGGLPRSLAAARNRRPRFRFSAPWLVAAASFLVSLVAVGWLAMLQGDILALQNEAQAARDRAARFERLSQVLASDKLAVRPLRPIAQNVPSHGMVYMDPLSGTGMLMCHDLPPIEQGRAYQVWFVRGNERVSGGLLWPDRSGNGSTMIQVPTDVMSYESVGLTDEPGTGSSWPTTPRVMGTPLKETAQ